MWSQTKAICGTSLRKGHCLVKLLWTLLPSSCFDSNIPTSTKKNYSKKQITLNPKIFVHHSTLQLNSCFRGKRLLLVRWELPCIPHTAAQRGVKSLKLLSLGRMPVADHWSCQLQLLHSLVTKHTPEMCLGSIPPANSKCSWTGCSYSKNPTQGLAELWDETVSVCV